MRTRDPSDQRLRLQLAQTAAKIVVEEGLEDYRAAKQKARDRLSLPAHTQLPSNAEIEAAIDSHQRLFCSQTQAATLQGLRQAACDAMLFLEQFRPKLVGSVLSGSANSHSTIELHLFPSFSEAVQLFLDEHCIPYQISTKCYRWNKREESIPVLKLDVNERSFKLALFPERGAEHAPLSPIDQRPMKRASYADVRDLVTVDPALPNSSRIGS